VIYDIIFSEKLTGDWMKNLRIAVLAFIFILFVEDRLFAQAITINEVMADPAGADYYDEFIELYNYGDSVQTLRGYYLEINGYVDTLDFVTDYGDIIPPKGFALIMDRGYLVEHKSSAYEDIIPDDALLISIQDNSLARTGLVNSEASQIYLFNPPGDTISAVLTTATPVSGYSWEKIEPSGTNQISNWGYCLNLRGTPGFWNSIAPRDQDVAISGFSVFTPLDQIIPYQPVNLKFTVKNVGLKAASSILIKCGTDRNADRQIDELLLSETISLPTADSVVKNVIVPGLPSGSHTILAEAIFVTDERPDNNRDSVIIRIPFPENCLIVNEFMYYPATDGGGEWVELFNIFSDTINLKEWTISDNSTSVQLTDQDFYLPPQRYLVIVNDSTTFISFWGRPALMLDCSTTMPALNNTKDSIIIRDHCRNLIEAMEYSSVWGYRQGTSLERKNPFETGNRAGNWSLSMDPDKATPGRENSIALRDCDLAIDSINVVQTGVPLCHNSPVSAQIFIRNNGIESSQSCTIRIRITNPLFGQIADTSTVIANSLATGETLALGINFCAIPGGVNNLIATIIWLADENTNNNQLKIELPVGYLPGMLVINEIMFAPLTGQCEWFEIYNNSGIRLDLDGWGFRDAFGKRTTLIDSCVAINASEYAIVAARSDFGLDYPDFLGTLMIPASFPTLNNTIDSLFLFDAVDQIIDNVCYRDSWGGEVGISLERLDPTQPGLDAGNWGASLWTATPGEANSIVKLNDNLAIFPGSFQFTDTLDDVDMNAHFLLKVKNIGRNPAKYFTINIYNDRNRDDSGASDELCWSQTISGPLAPDSTLLVTGRITGEKSGLNVCLSEIEYYSDQSTDDNYATANILVAYSDGCLTINEFLAYPLSNQIEFVECINIGDGAIDLAGWILGNHNSGVAIPTKEITAGQYVVFAEDSTYFNYFKPTGAKVIIPEKWPGLNNSADQIWLKDLTGKTIDALFYEAIWPVKSGYSTEKILPPLISNSMESWNLAVNAEHQTAGYLNSVTRPENDLSLDSLQLSSVTGDTNTIFWGRYFISNKGRNQACGANLSMIIISNLTEDKSQIELDCLKAEQADSGAFQIGPLASGTYDLIIRINWSSDQVAVNDTLFGSVKIAWPAGRLLLSEFMPFPLDIRAMNNSVAEYLEFYNPGQCTIDLTDWMISDQNTAICRRIPPDYILPADEYFVIAGDSSVLTFPDLVPHQVWISDNFPSLNNTEDAVYLYDPTGKPIDSLFYSSVWNITQGFAMERISFENSNRALNWRACVATAGGTPGQPNSVALQGSLKKVGIKTTADIFSPDDDGINDEIGIEYLLPFPSARLTLEIYDLIGRLVFRPAKNLATPAKGVIYWDGTSVFGGKARVGIYLVRCLANDIGSAKSVEYITTLVLAR